MITIQHLEKYYGDIKAVDNVSVEIKEGTVFGLIGTNGAGKSTVLRMIAGVLKPDNGLLLVDEMPVYNNIESKKRIFFIADEQYFFNNATGLEMAKYYSTVYNNFDMQLFGHYLDVFGLDGTRKINTFSKGMKKQLGILLAVSAKTKYILCDETFDGLDPVMRQAVKSLLAKEMEERKLTPIIASHNLRELEDICDHVGLLHRGDVLLSKDLEDMKCNIQKIQCVFKTQEDEAKALKGLEVIKKENRGSLRTITVRTTREEAYARLAAVDTVFYEILPLTLEEIFISETEVAGYDIKKLIMD